MDINNRFKGYSKIDLDDIMTLLDDYKDAVDEMESDHVTELKDMEQDYQERLEEKEAAIENLQAEIDSLREEQTITKMEGVVNG